MSFCFKLFKKILSIKKYFKKNKFQKHLVLCKPNFFRIEYEINPWMKVEKKSDASKAFKQWKLLLSKFKRNNVKISLINPIKDLPDMVFTANAGLYIKKNNSIIISKFKYKERQGESIYFEEFFSKKNIKIIKTKLDFEGAGDALFFMNKLIGGYGFRTDFLVYKEIKEYLQCEIIEVELIDSRFYHLDTCFCPLNNKDYLIYPKAFSEESLSRIRKLGGREIIVCEQDAVKFACNAVCVEDKVILPEGCGDTYDKLNRCGYNVIPVCMSEFLKSGGACKCLTLEISDE